MLTATVCIALSGAGLAIAFLHAYRRRFLRAVRLTAWSLLPVGLYMSGVLPLGQDVGEAVGDWAVDLVFDSTVWVGMAVLAVSAVLFVVARVAGDRRGDTPPAAERGAAPVGAGTTPAAGLRPGGGGKPKKSSRDDGLSDFREIEEILRRRGI
ncbi:hypothetical protein AQ490_14630 [Wenjunlia vitaminophila]|uniref:Cellulose synthase n=1 Tax=Wenjunlia vitaminophila TaxID=76728 RepID=A0A0T6LW36_WENVI|nr:hypothetical protein [Wenjunlia vitaminophila]KRV50334.1 hypothetical protein AQ490_14630 [Wenjunlia vitaminophila]